MRELEISCLPADIPDLIELDVSELGIGDSIHVSDIELEKVNILTELRRTVVVISAPTVIKADDVAEDEEALEGEEGEAVEGAEGEAAAAEGEAEKKDEAKPDEGKK